MPTGADLIAHLDRWFPPVLAQTWDRIGLVCGDPAAPVTRALLAVDVTPDTVDEAVARGANFMLAHHPLLLQGVHGVGVSSPKGALVHRLIRHDITLYTAHTNADAADPGVSDALGERLGLTGLRPLQADPRPALDKVVVFVPVDYEQALIDALSAAGAGELGDYERCAWTTVGTGTFLPREGADPAIGSVGQIEQVREARVEMVLDRRARQQVVAALRAAHPYEEPAFDVIELAALPDRTGTGRIGELPAPLTLARFVDWAADRLPATAWGVRGSGDPDREVRTVAVCGGAGGSLADLARSRGADAYLTADLRHHPTLEGVVERGPSAMALVDAAHWATEAPWLDAVARRMAETFGATVDVVVSRRVTDPWSVHAPSIHRLASEES